MSLRGKVEVILMYPKLLRNFCGFLRNKKNFINFPEKKFERGLRRKFYVFYEATLLI